MVVSSSEGCHDGRVLNSQLGRQDTLSTQKLTRLAHLLLPVTHNGGKPTTLYKGNHPLYIGHFAWWSGTQTLELGWPGSTCLLISLSNILFIC